MLSNLRGDILKTRDPKNLSFELKRDGWEVSEAITVNRNTDGFDWCFNGIYMMHERTYFPHSIFKEISSSYWCQRVYSDLQLAEKHAKKFGGEAMKCFYCDDNEPLWFIRFDDFDRAAKYCETIK